MEFLDGGQKTHQRGHYEYFEEIYDASKYRGSACTVQNINFRGYYPDRWEGLTDEQWEALKPKAEIKLKMYNKCYINVSIDGTVYPQKAERGQTYTIDFSKQSKLNDTVINIYSAPMIQEIGDISRLYVGTPNFANATRLRSLVVGSSTDGYKNSNLTSITFGNNKMLEYLYVQNLGSLTSGLNVTNCPSLIYVDASGSSFTGYEFADGGVLETAYIEKPTSIVFRNLQYLDSSNLQINDYSRLSTLRVENCPNIDTLALVNNATGLAYVRLLGVDWELGDDSSVLRRLLQVFGLDENGYNTATPPAVLTGKAHFSTILQRDADSFEGQWEGLKITANNLIPQYKITFLNYNGTSIKDKDGNNYVQWVNLGQNTHDPLLTGEVSTPSKPKTDKYVYTFDHWAVYANGVIAENAYDFNGVVTAPLILMAVYREDLRKFTVRWYTSNVNNGMLGGVWHSADGSNKTLLKEETSVEYGSGLSYDDFEHIKCTQSNDGATNYVEAYNFISWDKFTGCVTDDMDVYAIWRYAKIFKDDKGNLNLKDNSQQNNKELKYMTSAEINAVISCGEANNFFQQKDYFDFILGHDYSFSNVEEDIIVELGNELYLDGLTPVVPTDKNSNQIKLFSKDSPSFTMAIDYAFSNDANDYVPTNEKTLISCFANPDNGNDGFRVRYYNNKANLLWGDKNVNITTQMNRDMLVLRHIKGSDELFIYAFNGGTIQSGNYSDEMQTTTLKRTAFNETDAPLVFGGIAKCDEETGKYVASTDEKYIGSGIIYWCKIWYADLGDSIAKELASWTRDEVRQEYYSTTIDSAGTLYGSPYYLSNSNKRASASFCSSNLLRYLHRVMDSNSEVMSWHNSSIRDFLERYYPAIPNEYRCMVARVKVPALMKQGETTIGNSDGYIYLPCMTEMNMMFSITGNSAAYLGEGSIIPWNTTNGRRVKFRDVFTLDSSLNPSGNFLYSGTSEPIFGQGKGLYDTDNNPDGVKEYDIWYNNVNTAYIYLSAETLKQKNLAPVFKITQGEKYIGGWYASTSYWTRSTSIDYPQFFNQVAGGGGHGHTYPTSYYGVCPCFSIYAELTE